MNVFKMFAKISHTPFPPKYIPIMIWDGDCGFCKYWVIRWKHMTGDQINYRPFQEAAADFKDIPLKEFKKASRLVETNGRIFSGSDSAYRSYDYSLKKDYPFHKWYKSKDGLHRSVIMGITGSQNTARLCLSLLTYLLEKTLFLKQYSLLYVLELGIIVYFVAITI